MGSAALRKNIDWWLVIAAYALALFGVVIIFSATRGDVTAFHKKQLVSMVIGTGALFGAATLDYHLTTRFSRHLYILNIILLLVVWRFAPLVNGSRRWIRLSGFQLQPSEIAKLFTILTLAAYITRNHETIREFRTLLGSLAHIALPAALIYKQPDLGTALVLVAIWFGMVFIAGAKLKHLAALTGTGIALFALMVVTGKLHSYQLERIGNVLNAEANARGSGYHIVQARIAIGSGEMWGKGLLHSTQVRGGYIPEKQTDFIFTNVGEELGFAGSVGLILLYAFFLLRCTLIVAAADEDILGKMIATGVLGMFAFHILINIAMNIGMMPVVGVPLTFVSYGGTSVIVSLACVGLLLSVGRHHRNLIF